MTTCLAKCPKCDHAFSIEATPQARVVCPRCGAALTVPRQAVAPGRAGPRRLVVLGAACGLLVLVVAVIAVAMWARGPRAPRPRDEQQASAAATKLPATRTPPSTREPPAPAPRTDTQARPAWAAALAATDREARAHCRAGRYGQAIAAYRALAQRHDDPLLKQLVRDGVEDVRRQGAEACRQALRGAEKLLGGKQFDAARAALDLPLRRAGLPDAKRQAEALLARVEAAEQAHRKAQAAKQAKAKAAEQADAEAQRRREAERAFARALEPIDELLRQWDFGTAAEALDRLPLPHQSLAPRLDARREQVGRLRALHARMMAKIHGAEPRLTKRSLFIPGINGELTKADGKAITATLPNGQRETHAWPSLSPRSVARLVQLAIDPSRADDWVAAGLLGLAVGDAELAERSFAEAKARGADIEVYRDPLAAAAFAQAIALLDGKRFEEATAALTALEKGYGQTAWLAAHKADVEAARAKVRAGLRAADAEALYAEATALFRDRQLFRLKPLIDRLQRDYGDTRAAKDRERQPSVAEMARATAQLGNVVTVSQDGKGQHLSIQKAIDAADPNGLVLILDSAIYNERLLVPRSKRGLTIRAKEGARPILSSRLDATRSFRRLVDVEAADVTFDGLVLALHSAESRAYGLACVRVAAQPFRIQSCVLYIDGTYCRAVENPSGQTTMDLCAVAVHGYIAGSIEASRSIWLTHYLRISGTSRGQGKFTDCVLPKVSAYVPCEFHHCTVLGALELSTGPNVVRDCIAHQIEADRPGTEIEHCDVFGKPGYREFASPGVGCLSTNPQFTEPEHFDFRLKPTSPCRGRASDKGDIGCRYTRQMVELRKLAYELRERGIIQFTPFGQWRSSWLD